MKRNKCQEKALSRGRGAKRMGFQDSELSRKRVSRESGHIRQGGHGKEMSREEWTDLQGKGWRQKEVPKERERNTSRNFGNQVILLHSFLLWVSTPEITSLTALSHIQRGTGSPLSSVHAHTTSTRHALELARKRSRPFSSPGGPAVSLGAANFE